MRMHMRSKEKYTAFGTGRRFPLGRGEIILLGKLSEMFRQYGMHDDPPAAMNMVDGSLDQERAMFMATHSPDTITDYHDDDASAHLAEYERGRKWELGNTRQRTVKMEFQTSHRKDWNMPERDLVLDQTYLMTSYVKIATESFYLDQALQ